MIKIIDSNFAYFDEFRRFCRFDSFGTRIYSHYLCYGFECRFADFWVQIIDDMITASICRLDSDFVACILDNADIDELESFLWFQDKNTLTLNSRFARNIEKFCPNFISGDVLKYTDFTERNNENDIVDPEIKDYYNLLKTCESDHFFVPEYMYFLSDTIHRKNKGLCDVFAVSKDNKVVCAAMTVSHTEDAVILGAVATHPDYRKQGLGGYVVSSLANKHKDKNDVFIYTTIKKNTSFYQILGFKVVGQWVKFTYGGI